MLMPLLKSGSNRIHRKGRTRIARSAIEALENRTLLSASLSGTALNVTGTSGADTFTLSDDGTTITVQQGASAFTFADSSVSKIVVNPSAGGDTVNLLSNTKPVTITGGGLDTVDIGGGTLANIKAAVSVGNPTSFTALTIDGSTDPGLGQGGPSGTLTNSTFSGLSAGAISYTAAQLSALTIIDSNDLTVGNTGMLHGNAATLIEGQGENGFVNATVVATTGPLTVSLLNASGNVTVGTGNTQGIKGSLLIEQDEAIGGAVSINDSADTIGRNVSITGFVKVIGLTAVPIVYQGAGSEGNLVVNLGNGNDTLTIAGGADDAADQYSLGGGNNLVNYEGHAIESDITGGAGNDTLNISAGDQLNDMATFDGGAGTNTVILDNSAGPAGGPFEINSGGVSSGFGSVGYSNIQKMTILGGLADNIFDVDPTTDFPLLIHGGAGNDLIYGGAKNDTIYGDSGNDTIYGNGGNDSLFGGDGNDSLNGGPGIDVLTGGTGIDTMNDGEDPFVHIIADNIAPQGVTITGTWTPSTSTSSFYASNYITDGNTGKGTKSVTWAPTLPVTSAYQVYARWTSGSNRSNHVPFDVVHQGTTSTVFENEQKNNGAWVLLGTYNFAAGSGASVTVRNAGTTGYVVADAVRFIPVNSISGIAFDDTNGNAMQDAGEGPPAHPAIIYIDTNKDGVLDDGEPSVTADAAGNWSFTGLAPGTYRIREVNTPGFRHTTATYEDIVVSNGPNPETLHANPFGDLPATGPMPVLAINVGGPTFTLNSGLTFSADTLVYPGSLKVSHPYDVKNTDNDPLYYSYRISQQGFAYHIPVPNGNYNLVFWFADPDATRIGQHEFNVYAQYNLVLPSFDIFAAGGGKTPVIETVPISVTNGELIIAFNTLINNSLLSAFALYAT